MNESTKKKPVKSMKLYVWDGVLDGCRNSGIVFAYAYSLKQAVNLAKKQLSLDHFDGNKIDGVEPKLVRSKYCECVWGGD